MSDVEVVVVVCPPLSVSSCLHPLSESMSMSLSASSSCFEHLLHLPVSSVYVSWLSEISIMMSAFMFLLLDFSLFVDGVYGDENNDDSDFYLCHYLSSCRSLLCPFSMCFMSLFLDILLSGFNSGLDSFIVWDLICSNSSACLLDSYYVVFEDLYYLS